jgi:hypothetical protein
MIEPPSELLRELWGWIKTINWYVIIGALLGSAFYIVSTIDMPTWRRLMYWLFGAAGASFAAWASIEAFRLGPATAGLFAFFIGQIFIIASIRWRAGVDAGKFDDVAKNLIPRFGAPPAAFPQVVAPEDKVGKP